MDRDGKHGLMELATRACGSSTKPTAEEPFGTSTAISMKVNGLMTKLRVMASTHMQMEQNIKVSGKMICRTAGESKSGQMEANLRAITKQVVSMVRAATFGLMAADILGTGLRTK